ncbi:phasin family protein [Burkholderiaceae bacterium DAT-1]|nr:phasin family protein [Burkholderiaceae bacterium DAT-1]
MLRRNIGGRAVALDTIRFRKLEKKMFNTQDFAGLSQAQLEKSIRLSNIALSGVERLVSLQIDLARQLLEENTSNVRQLSEVKDLQGLVALQQQLSQPSVDKALSIARHVYEAASSTQTELSQLVEENVVEFNKGLVSALDRAVKSAPAGSEVVVSTLKNAVTTAASAYDTAVKTVKKVTTDFAEASVAAAETSAKAATTRAKKAAAPAAAA